MNLQFVDWLTNGLTLVVVKSLSRLKKGQSLHYNTTPNITQNNNDQSAIFYNKQYNA